MTLSASSCIFMHMPVPNALRAIIDAEPTADAEVHLRRLDLVRHNARDLADRRTAMAREAGAFLASGLAQYSKSELEEMIEYLRNEEMWRADTYKEIGARMLADASGYRLRAKQARKRGVVDHTSIEGAGRLEQNSENIFAIIEQLRDLRTLLEIELAERINRSTEERISARSADDIDRFFDNL